MQRRRSLLIVQIIILELLAALSSIIINVAAPSLPPAIVPYLRFTWPFLGALTVVLIALIVWRSRLQSTNESHINQPSLRDSRDRRAMLARVRSYWIDGVLEQSMGGNPLITPGLYIRPDAVADPWTLVHQQQERSLPTGTSITQAFDELAGSLLILGEPGSGKTTLLLELTRDLLERAQRDNARPIPLVFNLSSWGVKRQPIKSWLVEELYSRYQVPRPLAQTWIEYDQVILLLDGLDEISLAYRAACVDAINSYEREHYLVPIVVCSRTSDYLALPKQLSLRHAVTVQPLTAQQASTYLSESGSHTEAFRSDPGLLELATTPLMLNLLNLTFGVMPVEGLLATGSPSTRTRRRQLFATYVQRVLRTRDPKTHYTPQLTVRWLAWLAQKLTDDYRTEFYIERMQPDWLPSDRLRRLYYYAIRMGLDGLVIGLVCGLVGGLAAELAFGLMDGLVVGLASMLIGWLIGGVIRCFFYNRETLIEPAEVIVWSWASWMRHGCLNIVVSLVGSLVIGAGILSYSRFRLGILGGLAFGLAGALITLLLLMLISGVTFRMLDPQMIIRPNEGIVRSARNSLRLGVPSGLVCGLLAGLFFGLLKTASAGIVSGLLVGLFIGILVWMSMGGHALVEHFTLRSLLYYTGCTPWNYSRFLDHAENCNLLRRVGGSYIFVHRMLLEYFASLDIVAAPIAQMRRVRTREGKRVINRPRPVNNSAT